MSHASMTRGGFRKRFRDRSPLFFLSLFLGLVVVLDGGGWGAAADSAAAPDPPGLETAFRIAMQQGDTARRAALDLEARLLEAENLWHQHEAGPPRPQRVCFPVGVDEHMQPITECMSMGGASELQADQIKELFPLQVEVMREGARTAYLQTLASIRGEVVEAYYGAVLAQEALALQEASLARVRRQLEQVQALYERGVVPQLDVLQARSALAEAEAERFAAAERVHLANLELSLKTGRDLEDIPLILDAEPFRDSGSGDTGPPPADLRADLEAALAASAELRGAEGRLKVAEKEFELFREHRGTYPQRRAYREHELAIRTAEQDIRELRRRLELEVRSLHSRFGEIESRIAAAQERVEAAEEALRLAQLRYESGLSTIAEVLEAETALRAAELARLQAQVDRRIARGNLGILRGDGAEVAVAEYERILAEIRELR